MGCRLDLKNPKTYNEKLQWLKLYDRNPLYHNLVDKNEVKKYVEKMIGKQYVIPTLGEWDQPEDIDYNALPNQFVLKCTHDSGSIVICKDKKSFDRDKANSDLNKHLRKSLYWYGREWPYKGLIPRIIAEPYLEDSTGQLKDYKFFSFNGVLKVMFIASDRQLDNKPTTFDFYDMDFNHLDIIQGHPNSTSLLERPTNFELMKELAIKLSQNIPHVRVDFYEVNGKVYFGELTFFHFNGTVPFEPSEWDMKFGRWLELPLKH